MLFCMTTCFGGITYAVEEYSFDLQYKGTVLKNIEKDAEVLLVGVDATSHAKVQIKVDIKGPAIPEILATDSLGNRVNIAQVGYWGPTGGFAVGGSFSNVTPMKATFPEEGEYTITLSLVDLENANQIITSKAFTITVYEDESPIKNEIGNQNAIEELPKTGTTIWEYMLYLIGITLVLSILAVYLRSKQIN